MAIIKLELREKRERQNAGEYNGYAGLIHCSILFHWKDAFVE